MNTNFYTLCSQSLPVRELFTNDDDDIVRIFPFNQAPSDVQGLYATYQTISGNPSNLLSERAKDDYVTIQVDVWGDDAISVQAGFEAIRYAIELDCRVSFNMTDREPDTGKYRYSFDADFISKRHFLRD